MASVRVQADSAERAHRALVRTLGLFRNTMEPYFASFGISPAQWGLLRTLHRAEGEGKVGLRLSELGERLLVKPPSVTGLVDRMERMGLLVRQAADDDQRAKVVSLTPSARQLLRRVLQHHSRQIHMVMDGLAQSEQEQLLGLMEKLSVHLEGLRTQRATGDER